MSYTDKETGISAGNSHSEKNDMAVNQGSLEKMTDGLLLLDENLCISIPTPYMTQIALMDNLPFSITPKFKIHHSEQSKLFDRFVSGKNQDNQPLILLLESDKPDNDLLLLTCFKLVEHKDLNQTRFMIRVCHSNFYSSSKWKMFVDNFNLTSTEAKLCRALVDGLTLQDYAEKKSVSINTARTQLNNIFGKTSTTRQTSLLRLIFLFVRA